MRSVRFDPSRDRLFSVGDTVDRGPGSPRSRAFLAQPWIHAIRGNHEDMFLDIYADGEPDEDGLALQTRHNGMGWWMDLSRDERRAMIESFRQLPIAIEVETKRGKVGIVHAELPPGLDWNEFLKRVEANDHALIKQALWGRGRIRRRDASGVPGIGRLFVGHTPITRPARLGNVYYVDTGAVFGVLDDNPHTGRMTMADITCRTVVIEREPIIDGFVDVRKDDVPLDTPFGVYAKSR